MKHVLIVSFDFPPQGGTGTIRVTKFVKYLPEFGWQPVVVCSDTDWNPDESLARDVPSNVAVHRVSWPPPVRAMRPRLLSPAGSPVRSQSSLLKRLAIYIARRILIPDVNVLWIGAAQRACATVLRTQPCDAILTTSPPHSVHLVGDWVRSHIGIPWIADFRDVWTTDNPYLQHLGAWHHALQRRTERRVLEACDRAVVVTQPLAQQTADTFGRQLVDKIRVITNGFDPQDSFVQALPNDGLFTISYIGSLLNPRAQNQFQAGLKLAQAQSEAFRSAARINFIGHIDPDYKNQLTKLENVQVMNFAPHTVAIDMMHRSHVLIIILDKEAGYLEFTNKFFEYLAARRPILANVSPGIVSQTVTRENIGLVAPPDDAPAIAHALLTLFETIRANPESYRPPEALLARFNRRELAGKLASLLDETSNQ